MVLQMLCLFLYIYFAKGENCITDIYLYAQTSGLDNAGSNSDSTTMKFKYGRSEEITYLMGREKGTEFKKHKGNIWSFDAPGGCITTDDFRSMVIRTSSNDAWNIETAMTYGAYDDDVGGTLFLFTHDYSIYGWVDNPLTPPERTVSLTVNNVERDNCNAAKQCIKRILITAYTGGVGNGGSNDGCEFRLKYGNTETKKHLYDRSGNDREEDQGDLWDYEASAFGLNGCVTFDSITEAAFVAEGKDSWYIAIAFVTVELEQSGDFALLAGDRYLYKWLSTRDPPSEVATIPMRNKC